jgi:hypothetical protein
MRRLLSIACCLAWYVSLLAIGHSATLPENSSWTLVEKPLPKTPGDAIKRLQFSPDGSRILILGWNSLALYTKDLQEQIVSVPINGGSARWSRYLEDGSIAFNNVPSPELLLPDLTRHLLIRHHR